MHTFPKAVKNTCNNHTETLDKKHLFQSLPPPSLLSSSLLFLLLPHLPLLLTLILLTLSLSLSSYSEWMPLSREPFKGTFLWGRPVECDISPQRSFVRELLIGSWDILHHPTPNTHRHHPPNPPPHPYHPPPTTYSLSFATTPHTAPATTPLRAAYAAAGGGAVHLLI